MLFSLINYKIRKTGLDSFFRRVLFLFFFCFFFVKEKDWSIPFFFFTKHINREMFCKARTPGFAKRVFGCYCYGLCTVNEREGDFEQLQTFWNEGIPLSIHFCRVKERLVQNLWQLNVFSAETNVCLQFCYILLKSWFIFVLCLLKGLFIIRKIGLFSFAETP